MVAGTSASSGRISRTLFGFVVAISNLTAKYRTDDRALFGDENLGPVRGQLEVLLPQPEVDYCYLGGGYMFPRRDGIILGGTFDHDDWSLAPRPEQATQILEAHTEIMKGLKE